MLISSKDATARLNSSRNLINRLKQASASPMNLFGLGNNKPVVQQLTNPMTQERAKSELTAGLSFTNPFEKETTLEPSPRQSPILLPSPQENLKIDDVLDNVDTQIQLTLAHDKALGVLVNAVKMMGDKLDDIKPDKLPSVIAAASKTVESIRREKIELNKGRKEKNVHFHFYEPERRQLNDYQVIDV